MLETDPEPIKMICDLIQTQLDLGEADVFIYNQNYPIPPEKRMFVSVGLIGKKPFGVGSVYESEDVTGLVQIQQMQVQEVYSVLAYSVDGTARRRCHEILWALSGQAAQQAMEKYSFKIGQIPTAFIDVSEVEGASRINRYALTFRALVAYQRSRSVEYFNRYADPPFTLLTNP